MKKILCLGKLPPPYIGPALATEIILNSKLAKEFSLIHLDTSDHREINTLGKLDMMNFYLAFKHYYLLVFKIIRHNPEIIYYPNAQTSIAYLRDLPIIIIAKIFNKKLVGHLRGGNFRNWFNSSGFFMQWIVKFFHPMIDAQIVLGNNLKYMYEDIYPLEKLHVIPNGKDFSFNKVEKNFNRKVKILFLANFHKSKGIIDSLEALKFIKSVRSNYEMIFVGSWRAEETKLEFFSLLEEIGDNNIILKGRLTGDEKFKVFREADIFLLPTYYPNEGHPWVIVEAMAAGLPIITTNHAAISESVIDGNNGFLVEKQNPKQIAEKIDILINDIGLRHNMGRVSRQYYEDNFTEEKMSDKFSKVFNKVLYN